MACPDLNALFCKATEPSAKERRRFHAFGENSPRASTKALLPKAFSPATQSVWREVQQGWGQPVLSWSIACYEKVEWLRVGQVEATSACHEQFPPHAGHLLKDFDVTSMTRKIFSGKQSGGTCANDGNNWRRGERAHGCLIAMSRTVCQVLRASEADEGQPQEGIRNRR